MCFSIGWQPSLLARDLTSGTEWGSMNILMNQLQADTMARQTLYMTPVMNFSTFIPYGIPSGGMDYLINPAYAVGQYNNINNYSNWGMYA